MNTLLNLAPCLYFSCKDDGIIMQVNEKCCQKLGYTQEELVGKHTNTIFTIPTRIFQQTHFFPLLKIQGSAEEIFINLQTKEGTDLPVLINADRRIIDNEAHNIYVGIVVNNRKKFEEELIAARKTAETALHENTALKEAKQQLQEHAEQLDRQHTTVNKQNTELRQFNRVVTHDLQEPLRKIFVFSNMLLDMGGDGQQKSILEKLKNSTEQMRSILSGLQQYIWITENYPKKKVIDLNKLILVVREQLIKEFPEVRFHLQSETLPPVEADWEQMHVLFYQVFSNAIRFRKEGKDAQVSVIADNLQLNQFKNMKEKYKYRSYLRLQIRDTGIGFDADYKEQTFELFKRLHPNSGRGVGLSLCKKIIDNHEGYIDIESNKEEGTTIIVQLPLNEVQKTSIVFDKPEIN
ncbi:MAG TPA: ATP-binding protein [Flavisolibacter sp.]|nr:ATP-binding protein [Flavisolibacter sp.]